MKGWRLYILMLFVGIVGCHKDEAIPYDLLYQRWRMTQVQYSNGSLVDVSSDKQWAIVTFNYNGMILYGDDGKYDPCCSPFRFKRKGNTLDLVNVASIPLPELTPNPICVLADCAPIDNAWQIDRLTTTELVIKQERVVVTYQPYP